MRRHRTGIVLAAVTATVLLGTIPAATAATSPYCGITWGSVAKASPEMTGALVVGARAGRQDCYDRLVIDLGGMPAPGYDVRYTDAFRAEGSGNVLPTSGGAVLSISVHAWAYDFANGRSSVPWSVGTHVVGPAQFGAGGFPAFGDLVYGGTYEGYSSLGLGVRARLPFRVFTLGGPGAGSRLVIDVAHKW